MADSNADDLSGRDDARRVLFVCLGNICRSPTAEGVFAARARERELDDVFEVDSAGTSAYHVGEAADARMRAAAQKRGYSLTSRARQIRDADFETFDLIVAMDRANYGDILSRAESLGIADDVQRDSDEASDAACARVRTFCAYVPESGVEDVPDPYYGGAQGFERVLDLVEAGCDAIIDDLLEDGA